MQATAYEGYFENGKFYANGSVISIPDRQHVYITILEKHVQKNEHAEAWQDFLEGIKNVDNEPVGEFERVKFREADI